MFYCQEQKQKTEVELNISQKNSASLNNSVSAEEEKDNKVGGTKLRI